MNDQPANMPRLCILIESYYPVVGGMESQARNLAESLNTMGVPQLFVARRTSRSLSRLEMVDGIPVHRVPPAIPHSRGRWGMILGCLPTLYRLRTSYDLIFVPGMRVLGLAGVWAARRLGKKCVLKAESSGEMSGEFFKGGLRSVRLSNTSAAVRFVMKARNRYLARADGFVSMSKEMTGEFTSCGVDAAKITTIPQTVEVRRFFPVDSARKDELRRKLKLPAKGPMLIFTGRLVSYKGLPVLMRAWRDLAQTYLDATLVVVGAGGVDVYNCEAEIKRYAVDNGLQDRVVFTGAVGNVNEYLQASDIFVFPTENEAFGISLIEGMACGLPVISTSIGGIRDILTHEENGLVIKAGDQNQLTVSMRRLLDDRGLALRLGKAALTTVQERYTREIVATRYLDFFRSVCAK